jgi:DNA-directed RNA polymerase specialized sigma24 family protein
VANYNHVTWPQLDAAYTDEFGQVEAEVYRAAGDLWPLAETYSIRVLQDSQSGQRLLLKAVAVVSRVYRERPGQISNLEAYVYQTFKHLVLAQLEKENGHRRLETENHHQLAPPVDSASANPDRKILVQQIMRRMDTWMREVFELLVLGHTFEEIGPKYNQSAHALRTRFSKALNKLTKKIEAETLAAEKKSSSQ